MDGLLQTEDYARALISGPQAVTDEVAASRLANRIDVERRVIARRDPLSVWFVIDEAALRYRCVGSAEIMATQMRHLLSVAALPLVTVQVIPAVAHPANASGFVVADAPPWDKHVGRGVCLHGRGNGYLAGALVR